MTDLRLKSAFQTFGHTQALKDGSVKPKTFAFDFEEVSPIIAAFRRMVRGSEFDLCEMAITTYICAKSFNKPFTALPIFLVRAFHHGAILYNVASGVRSPKDLEGRRVGVSRGYTVTTGVWARGILREDYGVDLDKVEWVLSGDEHVLEYRAPANVGSIPKGKKLEDMLVAGEIAAAIGVTVDHPDVKPLIPHPTEMAFEGLRTRGRYPINHTLVVANDKLADHPGLARDVFAAFCESKRVWLDRLRANAIANPTKTDQFYRRVMDVAGGDPLPYGLAPNRATLETLIGYALDQKIIDRRVSVESLFDSATLALTG